MTNPALFSIVLLTYNRRERLQQQIVKLKNLHNEHIEIIVVDNCSEETVADLVSQEPRARLIRNAKNLGAVGRNVGMIHASGQYIITLDDDVYGITDDDLTTIAGIFDKQPRVAAINFSVREEGTNRITDWCHPRDMNPYHDQTFKTNDISEGAVAFRKTALDEVGYYPDYFFISHEGPDLAYRLINAGWSVIYSPDILVYHGYEQRGRVSWRRYYYDTRNQLWLAIRNFTFLYGLRKVPLAWISVMIYAIRDGYFKYWLKGLYDSIKGCPRALRDRYPPNNQAIRQWHEIERFQPSFLTRLKKRLFNNQVRG
jgi:GT2 family glycosyltransferase